MPRHLLWSGYVWEATRTPKHLPAQFYQYPGLRDTINKLKRLCKLITNLCTYLVQNKASIVNTASGIGQASPYTVLRLKGAANSLVNTHMNKKRQMRWAPIGVDRVLQGRAAVADGRLKQAKLELAACPRFFPLSS